MAIWNQWISKNLISCAIFTLLSGAAAATEPVAKLPDAQETCGFTLTVLLAQDVEDQLARAMENQLIQSLPKEIPLPEESTFFALLQPEGVRIQGGLKDDDMNNQLEAKLSHRYLQQQYNIEIAGSYDDDATNDLHCSLKASQPLVQGIWVAWKPTETIVYQGPPRKTEEISRFLFEHEVKSVIPNEELSAVNALKKEYDEERRQTEQLENSEPLLRPYTIELMNKLKGFLSGLF